MRDVAMRARCAVAVANHAAGLEVVDAPGREAVLQAAANHLQVVRLRAQPLQAEAAHAPVLWKPGQGAAAGQAGAQRQPEARRGGKEGVSKCRTRWAQ